MILEIRVSTGERVAEPGETVRMLRVRIDDEHLARVLFENFSDILRSDAQEFVYSQGKTHYLE